MENNQIPPETIVEQVAQEYAASKGSLLGIRETVLAYLKAAPEKDQLLPLLQARLEGMGMSRSTFSWLVEEADFLQLPAYNRAGVYLSGGPKTLLEIGVAENLKPTLEELFKRGEKRAATEVVFMYLENLRSPVPELRKYTAVTFREIVGLVPAAALSNYAKRFVDLFLDALKQEAQPVIVEALAQNTGLVLSRLQALEEYGCINYLLSEVKKTAQGAGVPQEKKAILEQALKELDLQGLCKQIIGIMDQAAMDGEKNALILNLVRKAMPGCLPCLLELLLRRSAAAAPPFDLYLQNIALMDMMKEFKPDSLVEIGELLESGEKSKVDLVFDILHYFHDEGLLYLYEKALGSLSRDIRLRALKGLVGLNLDSSFRLLGSLFPKEDRNIQKEIIIWLGESSHQKTALELLLKIKEDAEHAGNKKEILEAVKKIQKRLE